MGGVANVLPVNSTVPPVGVAYQLITAPGTGTTERFTGPVPHVYEFVPEACGGAGKGTRETVADPPDVPEQLLFEVLTRV
jgi:hypothetical protein